MSQVIILCGNMSVGKTTLAKIFSDKAGYKYIDFDDFLWSNRDPPVPPREIISRLCKLLSPDDENYVIDNWFKWSLGWEKDIDKDNSIAILDSMVDHDITVMLIGVSNSTIKERHSKRSFNGIDNDWYYENMEYLQDSLYKGFSNFTKRK